MIDIVRTLNERSLVGLLIISLCLLWVIFPAKAQGKRFSAKVLAAFCDSPLGAPYDDGVCAGYITGVADVMASDPAMEGKLCLPRDLSTADFARLVSRYLSRRPELEQAPAAGVVREALLAAYPCGG